MNKLFINVLKPIKYVAIYALLLLFLSPFFLVLLNSLKTDAEFIASPLSLPAHFSLDNFVKAFQAMHFVNSFMNSLIVTVAGTLLVVILSAMTAHRFVRHKSRFNKIFFYVMVATMIIPFQAIMIPLVGIYGAKLHLLGNKWILIYMCIGFGVSQAVFMYSGFIKSIPAELEEAALIDGCNKLQMFFRIVWPLLKTITITLVIMNVLWLWNDYLLPTLVLGSSFKQLTLPLSTYSFYGSYTADYTLIMAALIMTMTPVIIMYLFLQRHIIAGIVNGAIK